MKDRKNKENFLSPRLLCPLEVPGKKCIQTERNKNNTCHLISKKKKDFDKYSTPLHGDIKCTKDIPEHNKGSL